MHAAVGPRLLVYSGPEEARATVEQVVAPHLEVVWVEPVRDAVAEALRGATAFLDASMKVRIDAGMIADAAELRVITIATTGADHIDASALALRDIPLFTLAGQREVLQRLTAAAEHSWLLLMACARRLRAAWEDVLDGGWNRVEFPGVMLRGRVLGLIGCGRIGGCMARYAQAFDMTVVGHDPGLAVFPSGVRRVPLEELMATADFISVHVPLNEHTRQLVDRDCFARVKPGSIFINTSRGEVADERALLEALESGRLAAAGLDVLAGEPEVADHPLRLYAMTHANLIITPHIGGFSPDAVRIAVEHAARRALDYLGATRER